MAQPPADDTPDVLWRSVDHLVGPEDLGMTQLSKPSDLYTALTATGRCDEGSKANAGTVCALISYVPLGADPKAYDKTLRPVFRVSSSERIWTIIDGKLARVSASSLEIADDFRDQGASVPPLPVIAVAGVRENEDRCNADLPCVDISYYLQLIDEVGILSNGCVDEIWNPKGGPTDVGAQKRCKYVTRG